MYSEKEIAALNSTDAGRRLLEAHRREEAELREIEKMLRSPASWRIFGPFGSVLLALPKPNGQSPVKVLRGRQEEMMRAMGYHTAYTDYTSVTFLGSFLDRLTKLGKAYVLGHEGGHITLKHGARRCAREPMDWNLAGDTRINDILNRLIMPQLMKGGKEFHPDMLVKKGSLNGIGLTPDSKHWCVQFRNNTEEEIYYLLRDERRRRREDGQGKQGNRGGGGLGDFDFDIPTLDDHMDESPLELRERLKKQFGDEGENLANDLNLPRNEKEQRNREKIAHDAVITARQRSRTASRGIGSAIDHFVDDAIEFDRQARSKFRFKLFGNQELYEAQQGRIMEDPDQPDELSVASRSARVREVLGLGGEVYRPDLVRKERTSHALWIQDTSGSMGQTDLVKSAIECKGLHTNNDCQMTVVSADTSARDKFVIMPGDKFPVPLPIKGGGGTDMFTPLVDEICSAKQPYDLVVVCTDGDFHPFTRTQLRDAIAKREPTRIEWIPPIAILVTTDHFDSPDLNAAARTFPQGSFRVFALTDPEQNKVRADVTVTPESITPG